MIILKLKNTEKSIDKCYLVKHIKILKCFSLERNNTFKKHSIRIIPIHQTKQTTKEKRGDEMKDG